MQGPRRFLTGPRPATPRRARRDGALVRLCRFCLRETGSAVAKVLTLCALLVLLLLVLFDGRNVVLRHLDPRLSQVAARWLGAEEVVVGSVRFSLGAGTDPAGLVLNDVRIGGGDGLPELRLPRVATGFTMLDGLMGRVRPHTIELSGAALSLTRDRDGSMLLGGGAPGEAGALLFGGADMAADPPDFTAMLQAARVLDAHDMLSRLERVDLRDVALRFHDATEGRTWEAESAAGYLRREAYGLSGSVRAVFHEGQSGQEIAVSAAISRNDRLEETRYAVEFRNARPADVAGQVAVLDWLALVDAPVDGVLAVVIRDDGALVSLAGRLRMGAGRIAPLEGREIGFESASAYFSYDPDRDAFDVAELTIDSSFGTVRSHGRISIDRDAEEGIAGLVGQMDLSQVSVARIDRAEPPVTFPRGEAVARVRFDPFVIELGRVGLRDGDSRLSVSGHIAPRHTHWEVALDGHAAGLGADRALALWPEPLAPGLRRWITGRVTEVRLTRFDAHFRQTAEGPRAGLSFDFEDGVARIFPQMPPLVGAKGSGQVIAGRFDLVLDEGRTGPGPGGGVDLSGSRMTVADTTVKPAQAEFRLAGAGAIPDLLALIDNPPLRLMSRAGQGTDLATGRADVSATLSLPLKERLAMDEVRAEVTARLTGVAAERLVPGRPIAADELTLTADNESLQVSGPVRVAGVPVTARYRRGLGAGAPPAEVAGTLDVTPKSVAGLGIPLPPGSLSGSAAGRFRITLPEGAPPAFSADVALAGAGVGIPALNWRKPAQSPGSLSLEGALSDPPRVDAIRLEGPGLSLAGRIELAGGGLVGADLSRLRLGNWLDAPVRWRAGEGGRSEVTIAGGRIDLRGGLPENDLSGPGMRLSFAPDEVIVGDSIRLSDVRGEITGESMPRGRFTARLNGRAPISGFMRAGNEVFLLAEDGGAVLRDAGLFRNAVGGTLRVSLKPSPNGGPVTGVFSLADTRVVSAKVLADILSGASVGRLAREVQNSGVRFDEAQGRFTIDGGRIFIAGGRAVGQSLGVTLEGSYDMAAEALDMAGVVSPFYAVNGLVERLPILGRLLGGRPGEGLLGATFTITGSGAAPKIAVNPLAMLAPGVARGMFETRSRNGPGG